MVAVGNRKGHRTPTPEGLTKIKRISFETFLNLKALLKKFSQRPKAKRTVVKHLAVGSLPEWTKGLSGSGEAWLKPTNGYKPSNIVNAYESLFWRWRRVIAWERYINDKK